MLYLSWQVLLQIQAAYVLDEEYSIDGYGPTASKLLRIFLAAAIVDSGNKLTVSRKALAEFSEQLQKRRGFTILCSPGDDHDMELHIEWYD